MPCLLILESGSDVHDAFAANFESAGYEVLRAESCSRALALHRQHGADLIVTDLLMDDMDGLQMLRALSREPHAPPVIAVNGKETSDLFLLAMNRQAFQAVADPFGCAGLRPRPSVARA